MPFYIHANCLRTCQGKLVHVAKCLLDAAPIFEFLVLDARLYLCSDNLMFSVYHTNSAI